MNPLKRLFVGRDHSNRSSLRAAQRRQTRMFVELLEPRQLMSTFTVNTTGDLSSGGSPGSVSLRMAINESDATPATASNPNLIKFDISSTAALETISPKSALPVLTQPVILDGTSEPGYLASLPPLIQVVGTSAGTTAVGLTITASGSQVRGLAIDGFKAGGLLVNGASNVTIRQDWIGVEPSASESPQGNVGYGVMLEGGAKGGTLVGDVISGNSGDGVILSGSGTENNVLQADFVGTDSSGSQCRPNTADGVLLEGSASHNTLGGATAAELNVISGNGTNGVELASAAQGNVVDGNYIGASYPTDDDSSSALPNQKNGVELDSGATNNTIGGSTTVINVISGNAGNGVLITGATTKNVIDGDDIGADAGGNDVMANQGDGVMIMGSASDNTIGGTHTNQRNVISGNKGSGVEISGTGTDANSVEGNYLGIAGDGATGLDNGADGVRIDGNANSNTIGGTVAGARNTISSNVGNGVLISDTGTSYNVVLGNFIGTDSNGETAYDDESDRLGNENDGVRVQKGATLNTIGGTTTTDVNVISGNLQSGIALSGSGTSHNLVAGNYIGTDAGGSAIYDSSGQQIGNVVDGVLVELNAAYNTIGGTSATQRNVITGNSMMGVEVNHASFTLVEGDYVGTDFTGTAALGNGGGGVFIHAARDQRHRRRLGRGGR